MPHVPNENCRSLWTTKIWNAFCSCCRRRMNWTADSCTDRFNCATDGDWTYHTKAPYATQRNYFAETDESIRSFAGDARQLAQSITGIEMLPVIDNHSTCAVAMLASRTAGIALAASGRVSVCLSVCLHTNWKSDQRLMYSGGSRIVLKGVRQIHPSLQ